MSDFEYKQRESTKEYRSGWDRIFGKKTARKHPDCVAGMCGINPCKGSGPCYIMVLPKSPPPGSPKAAS